jgi:hypothetical protein
MAFCSQCGTTLAGTFCTQCGAPAAKAAQPATVAAPAHAKRRTSPLVWVLLIVLGLFGIGAIAVIGTGAFFLNKVRQAGVDPELWRTNPGLAVGKVMAAVNPNLEVVRTNGSEGTVTLRDRHSGKQFSIGIDAARNGSFTLRADDEGGKQATIEFGGDAKIPAWMPQYPGSKPQQVFSARGETEREGGEAGSFTFKTPDSSSKISEFYEQKAREMDLPLRTSVFGTVIAGDEDRGRWFKVVTSSGSDETSVSVTYGRKL